MADAATLDRVDESIDALCASLQVITRDAPLRAFLQHIANLARVLVNARYCALGIVEGERFTDFIVSGISEAERAAIGALPRGTAFSAS